MPTRLHEYFLLTSFMFVLKIMTDCDVLLFNNFFFHCNVTRFNVLSLVNLCRLIWMRFLLYGTVTALDVFEISVLIMDGRTSCLHVRNCTTPLTTYVQLIALSLNVVVKNVSQRQSYRVMTRCSNYVVS